MEQHLLDLEMKEREYVNVSTWKSILTTLNEYVHEWLIRVDEGDQVSQWLDADLWLFQSMLPTCGKHTLK